MANKDDINVLISKIEDAEIKGGNEYLNVLKVLVKNGLYPEEVLTKVILSQFSGTARTSKAECNALREQCQSNNGRLACSNYISKCSDDLNPAFCKAPTTFTPAKELYKTVTAEVISKLCPETCLVQECYKNPEKHGKLDSTNLITPELLTCLLA
uniref:Uncharacterized protein n=1 Tax=Panagrolaimus sp. PS1159 TaxID=55785 RepID=A0AC35GBP6_9BILA